MDSSYYNKEPRDLLTTKIRVLWEDFRNVAFRQRDTEARKRTIPSREKIAAEWEAAKRLRRENHAVDPADCVDIAFIGVWDTVSAIATPFDELREFIGRYIWPIWFADNTLGPEVKRACHALALDEQRRTFHPELWNEKNGEDTRIKQVWFAGVHSNVGGGYPKQGMSLVTLDWMMNEASQAGLRFIRKDLDFVREHQDVHDKMYDSRAGVAVYYRWSPRDLSELCVEHKIPAPKIHISLFERIANGTFGVNGIDSYSPGNIPYNFEIDTGGSIEWPASQVVAGIQPLVKAGGTGSKPSLLAEMDKEVRSGKRSHTVFLAVTLLTLLIVASVGARALCGCASCIDLLLLLGAMVLFFLGGLVVHSWANGVDLKLCRKYTDFWHKRRRPLRMLLP